MLNRSTQFPEPKYSKLTLRSIDLISISPKPLFKEERKICDFECQITQVDILEPTKSKVLKEASLSVQGESLADIEDYTALDLAIERGIRTPKSFIHIKPHRRLLWITTIRDRIRRITHDAGIANHLTSLITESLIINNCSIID